MGKIDKIKLKDFKSFRNAVIPFVDGFTTVVGPNGSGKSNLNDAILFVLGEGSMKSLRAGRLTDLVHHSSKTGEAEVTIEFKDNSDRYTISRSIDKSGSSVYRLNGKRTTRAELVELLSTMHVPPEGHNIIMQGDVMSIINMTPKQRREVIDDISGIAEYNQKKDKALGELEQVEGKVKEANIILYERGGYLKEIKKERDEALRYRRFEQEKKDLKHAIIASELKEVEANYTSARDKVAALEKDLDGLRAEMKNASARISNWEQQLGALQKEIMAKGEKEQIAISKEIEQLKSKLSLTQEKVRNRHEDIRDAEAEIQRARHGIEASKGESAEKRKQLELLRKEDASYEARVKEKERDLAAYMAELREKNLLVGDSMQKLEEMNAAIAKRKEAFYELKGRLDQLREKISVRKLSVSDRSTEREESDKRTDDLREAFDAANKQFAEHKRSLKGFEQELDGLFNQEKALNKELADADSQLDSAREGYHSLQSKVATIRSMTGNTASDSVMKAKAELPGVIGRVEDLCTFDVKYASALQAAAGARMHFIVTKDVAAATNAIKWLKARKLGRTTFIPLDRIRPVELGQEAQDAMRHPKAVDFAIKLVEFRKEHHEVFSFVFGDTVVVQDIDAVKEIDDAAKKRGAPGCRMATLDGDLAEASGALTGGFQQGVLTLQEVKKLDELKGSLELLQKRHDKTVRQLEELREKMNYTRGQKAEVELKVKEFDVRVGELQHRIDEHLAMAKKYTLSADDIRKEIDGLKAELGEGDGALKRMQAEIADAEKRKDEAREKADSPEAKVVSERLEDMQKRVQALRDQRAEVIIQINSITAELEKFIGEREKAHSDNIAENERLAKKWREEIAGLEAEDKAVQAVLREKQAAEKEITSSVHGLIEQRDLLEGEMRKLAEQRGQLQRQTESKQSQFNEENFNKAKWETRFADLRAEFDENTPVKEFKLTVEEMKAEAEELGHKMKNLEPINLAAIEKYDKYLAELDGMKEKAKKLEEEKLAVFNLMQEIETRRKDAFVVTFNEIRKHFDIIYKQFYPGTDAFADIKLQNEDDPFEGGLLIEARPAGKPLKVIDAMSGGEKTLAALAFLFGVQAYKPSPFYILDEADAALDKPNSERLAQMIRARSSDCQFIVITHNNPMIHQSDQIVGVSMDKKAGSSIVEVDLKRLPAAQGGEAVLKA